MQEMSTQRFPIFEVLALLCPKELYGPKIRLGRDIDGGYVIADMFKGVRSLLSYGVGPDVSFEYDVAQRGVDVFMFDHTVAATPQSHPRFHYTREGVAAVANPAMRLRTLEEHIATIGQKRLTNGILKIDIEGYEVEVLRAASPKTLAIFSQFALEFHSLSKLNEAEFRKNVRECLLRINENFNLIHVHANNGGGVVNVEGFMIPDVLELTYVRKDLFQCGPNETVFPTVHDRPNNHWCPDILLHGFPFLPGSEGLLASGAMTASLKESVRGADRV